MAADLVSEVEDHWHGQRVGNPDQRHRQRQIAPQHERYYGGQRHLKGNGQEGAKDADEKGHGGGTTIKVPQVGGENLLAQKVQ